MDPQLAISLLVLLVTVAVILGGALLYPPTRTFAKRYGLKIALLLLTLGAAVLTAIFLRKKSSNIPLDNTIKHITAELQVTELEAELKKQQAATDLKIAEVKHEDIVKELETIKAEPVVDKRLEQLAALSKKLYGG
jgi:hypothetical protein